MIPIKTQKTVPNISKPPKPINSQPPVSKSVASKQRVQPAKLTGFCDIVSQAALKKGKIPTGKAKPIAKVTASKTIEVAKTKTKMKTTTTTTTTNNSISSTKLKSVDKWEEFREKKLAEMKQHKINVERRMQTSRNIDGQMYWSQRADKLKRYPKHEALHPSWYTENIYSNNSVDLEVAPNSGSPQYIRDDQYDPNCYDREPFHRKKMHIETGYGYPKSRSCCFGYEDRPKPMLMPKSSSFTGYSSRGMNMNNNNNNNSNIRSVYSTVEEEENLLDVQHRNNNSMNRNNNVNRSGLRKFYCWENDRQHNADKDDLYTTNVPHIEDGNSEIYQIERDRSYYSKKPNIDVHDVHATTNANYIRNIWHNRHRSSSLYKVHNINEINGNYCGDSMPYEKGHRELDTHHPFEEEYLIIHQNNPNCNVFSARNSFDDPGSVSRRQSQSQSYHSNEVYAMDAYDEKYTYLNRDRNKNYLDRTLGFSANSSHHHHHHHHHRSKSMLEVKPPNRFDDDSSSDSTIDDLYDFNFDFANQIDLDYRNNNRLEKNINEDNYSKYRNVNNNIDDTDDDVNDDDFDDNNSQSDGDNDINFNSLTSPSHRARYPSSDNEYPSLSNRNAHDRFYENCLSPTEFYPAVSNNSNNCNQNMMSPNGNTTAAAAAATTTIGKGQHHINDVDSLDNNKIYNNNNNIDSLDDGNTNMNGAISLINNIFSIYKPRKYSPVNSSRATTNRKMGSITKCMNMPSTVRPLGAPYNDFLTSMKRPLTITSSCFTTQKRNWIVPSSASVDQAHFKIIPEKTGLKISPLYRFGYEDDSKLRLKCTARPLLFPL